jgi:hypothetical protein
MQNTPSNKALDGQQKWKAHLADAKLGCGVKIPVALSLLFGKIYLNMD